MLVSTPTTRANDAAYIITLGLSGHCPEWAWDESELTLYMKIYNACLTYERAGIEDKLRDLHK